MTTKTSTLWSSQSAPDAQMIAYTVGDDRDIDSRLLRWDVIGSLGHLEALRGGGVISPADHKRFRRALRAALAAVDDGTLVIGPAHEDCHSALEFWLTEHHGQVGERIHAGRSRNDQITLDLRLYLKDATLLLHARLIELSKCLLEFGRRHRQVVWPGYTHQRIAMPSGAGAWAAGYAEQLLDSATSIAGLWPRLDRSPLGSAAGYGVPLDLDRRAAAKALGFDDLDLAVTGVQNARGQLEAATLFWCADAAHPLAKLSADAILYSGDEYGWLVLPDELSTGSSIMPQKRNPDLFELTRARAASITGELATVMAIKAGLPGGYHRDFQLLKAPLFRGLDRLTEMLGMMITAVPRLGVDRARAKEALRNESFATDEAIRLVRSGVPFRTAYRDVAARVKRGEQVPVPTAKEILATRSGPGGIGNPGFTELAGRSRLEANWNRIERRRFDRALRKLTTERKQ
jgi:argininosuccinate lyase